MRVKGSEPLPASTSGQFTRCPLNHPKHCIICYAYSIDTQATPLTLLTQLSPLDRKQLVLGSVGYYFFLCHDDSQDDDMTPAEAYAEYSNMSDEELINDSSVYDIFDSCEEYYNSYESYIPSGYSL